MVVKMIHDLRKRMEAQTKKIQEIKAVRHKEQTNRGVEQYSNWNEKYTRRN